MRKKTPLTFLTVFFILILFQFTIAGNGNKGKMLVLGFKSPLINDIQSRLLSERVLWELQSRGYPIVPVMEYERVFSEMPGSYTRTMDKIFLKNYCMHFKADYAVSGSLETKKFNSIIKEIKPNIVYNCRLIIYSREKDKFTLLNLDINGGDNYFKFFVKLSEEIVPAVEKSF